MLTVAICTCRRPDGLARLLEALQRIDADVARSGRGRERSGSGGRPGVSAIRRRVSLAAPLYHGTQARYFVCSQPGGGRKSAAYAGCSRYAR